MYLYEETQSMRITVSQLRRLIREAVQEVIDQENGLPSPEEIEALEQLDAALNSLSPEVRSELITAAAARPDEFQKAAMKAENRLYEHYQMKGSDSWTAAERQAHERQHGPEITGTAVGATFGGLFGGSAAAMVPGAAAPGIAAAVAAVSFGLLSDYLTWKKNNKTKGVKDFFLALVGK